MTDDKKQSGAPESEQPTAASGAAETSVEKENKKKNPAETENEKHASAEEKPTAEAPVEEKPADDAVAVLTAENRDLKERYMRLAADMENLRKRTEREKSDIAKYAISDFARDILTMSDNFQRAISAVSPEAAAEDENLRNFLEGVEITERELQKVLERHGVTKIDPKGEKFDPNMHQAVQQIDNPDLPNNTVCDVYAVGYTIADRVLRHAVVAVAKGGPKEMPAAAAEAPKPEPESAAKTETTAAAGEEGTDSSEDASVGAKVDKNV